MKCNCAILLVQHRTTFGSFKLKPTASELPPSARPVMAKISPTSLKHNSAVDIDKLVSTVILYQNTCFYLEA